MRRAESAARPIDNPIIVCGVARSGTTFVRNLLDSHDDIAMTDEFFLYRTPSLPTLFEEVEQAFANRNPVEKWKEQRQEIMRSLWFCASRSPRMEKGKRARRFGNKTPGAEHYIEFYDRIFELCKPLYVYVLREGKEVFLSRKNMDWTPKPPSVKTQLKRYLDSLAAIDSLREVAPERVLVFPLDLIGAGSPERIEQVERLFAFVKEEVTDQVIAFVDDWTPAQTTQSKMRGSGRERLKHLRPEELAYLENHPRYQEAMRRYGYAR